MKEYSFKDLQSEGSEWTAKNFPGGEPWWPLLGVCEEAGELAHAFLKNAQGIRGTPEEHRAAMEDAVGDIIIYLADFCGRNGLDFSECVSKTWDEVKKRDWTKNRKDGLV